MNDIVPGLLKAIEKTFAELVDNDAALAEIRKKIESGNATYSDAHDFAGRLAKLRTQALKTHLGADILPDGKAYWNIVNRLVRPSFEADHGLISGVCVDVQELLNAAAQIGIKAQTAPLNQSRVKGILNKMAGEDYEKVEWLIGAPVDNLYRSVVDDHVKANAEFHYRSGLSPKIVRTTDGHCCNWCTARAGTYDYHPDMDNEIFRRHENCGCKVEYFPADGKKNKIVWDEKTLSKRQKEEKRKAERERLKAKRT